MTTTKYYTIPKFTSNLSDINEPIVQIENALNDLASLKGNQCILQQDVVISSDAGLGDLVYFDTENTCYAPAIAAIQNTFGENGQSIQAPSSRVEGIIVDINNKVLLRQGLYISNAVVQAVLGKVGANPGIYYLSPTDKGKAVSQPGWNMRQPCISYYGDGKFSMMNHYLAHDNHHHIHRTVKGAQTTKIFTIASSDSLYPWLNITTCAFFIDSVLTQATVTENEAKTLKTIETTKAGEYLDIFTHIPFAYGDSVVRSIESKSLNVISNNGQYSVDMPSWEVVQPTSYTPKAISQIQGNTLKKIPVVTGIVSQDLTIINKGNGVYNIQNKSPKLYEYIPCTDIKLSAAQRVSKDIFTFSTLPAKTNSSITASAYVQRQLYDNYIVNAHIISDSVLPSDITLQFYCVDLTTSTLNTSPEAVVKCKASKTSDYIYTLLGTDIKIPQKCLLVLKIVQPSTVTKDTNILSIGFKLQKSISDSVDCDTTSFQIQMNQIVG